MASVGSIGNSSGLAVKQPSSLVSGGSGDDSADDAKVSSSRGSDGPRRSGRQRTMSADGAEAVANKVTIDDYVARAKAQYHRDHPNRSSAPSTIVAPGGVNSGSPSFLPLSSLLPSLPATSVSSLAAAAASQGNVLHGINAARTAHDTTDTKANTILPSAPVSGPLHGSGERHHRSKHRHHRDRHRSVSSSSSSSSSDDELTRGQHSLYYRGDRIKPRKQWRLSAVRAMRARYPSFSALFDAAKVTTMRNKFEGEEVAAVLDQLLAAHDSLNHVSITMNHVAHARTAIAIGMELAIRRLEGIIRADATGGDWSYATSLSLLKRVNLGNDDLNRSVTADVARTRAATKVNNSNGRGNGNGDSSYRGRRQYRGRGGKGGDHTNSNTKSSSNDKADGK